jgi:hypothetical protein
MKEVFAEAVYDYRDLVSYIKSRGADPALKTAYYKQELDIRALMHQYEIERARFCKMERETRILTDQEMFSYEKTRYFYIDVDPNVKKALRSLVKSYPHLYGRKKKTALINTVDRCVLFRLMLNNDVLENRFYRELRIDRIIESERLSKKSINYVFQKFIKR